MITMSFGDADRRVERRGEGLPGQLEPPAVDFEDKITGQCERKKRDNTHARVDDRASQEERSKRFYVHILSPGVKELYDLELNTAMVARLLLFRAVERCCLHLLGKSIGPEFL